jgi:hypothetical protein
VLSVSLLSMSCLSLLHLPLLGSSIKGVKEGLLQGQLYLLFFSDECAQHIMFVSLEVTVCPSSYLLKYLYI